jgi:glycosyltransferase involved in cell wall biosynthesis
VALDSLTVVIPTFNSAATLAGTLASIVSQLPGPSEIIVIDSASTDGTLEIVKQFRDRVNRWLSEPDDGPYDGMNKGVRLASGQIIGILNSDDLWEPGTVASVLEAFAAGGERLGIVHGNVLYRDLDGSSRILRPVTGPSRRLGLGVPFLHPATFVRRGIYTRVGLYNLRYAMCADQEFAHRCLRRGVGDVHIDQILTEMRAGGLSSRNDYRHELEALHRTFSIGRRLTVKFLWAGLQDVRYFNGDIKASVLGAIALSAKRLLLRGVRRLLLWSNLGRCVR